MPLFKLNESIETVAHNAIGNFLMGEIIPLEQRNG